MNNSKRKLVITNIFIAIILALVVAVNAVAAYWDQALLLYFGSIGGTELGYKSAYSTDEELRIAQEQLVRDIVDEGTVLLKNNGALPLKGNESVTIFGQSAIDWANSGLGSAALATEQDPALNLKGSLENVGFKVNDVVWSFYQNTGRKMGKGGDGQGADWSLNETKWAELNSSCGSSFGSFNDVAIVLISRLGCEGADLPTEMSRYDGTADEHYLELSSTEKEILEEIEKAGFKKTVVILKTGNAMQMDFVDVAKYGVDACLWMGGTGANGVEEVGKILNGTVNPSGHLPDTMAYDNFSAPAMQNFGDFRYLDSTGKLLNINYINYGESIYVGYKYYETRYEDKVMGTGNAGAYDYAKTVAYPFGYGLSYTEFEYDNFSIKEKDGEITVEVTVKNVGEVKGKDAVEVYFQSPFTDYDKKNGVEKSAIALAAIAKTDYIEPNRSQKVRIIFNADDVMKSYDANNAKSYIIDEGKYYITVGHDAHDALNNVLAVKGYKKSDGMTADGNAELVGVYEVESFKKIENDLTTGTKVTNQFDDAVSADAKYLSRTDWSVMDNDGLKYATGTMSGVSYTTDKERNVYTLVASDELIKSINNIGWAASGIPKEAENSAEAIIAKEAEVKFKDMKDVPYEDPLWDELVRQLKVSELHSLYNKAGYSTRELEVIGKPRTYDYDGPLGLTSYVSDWNSFAYPATNVLAATFNTELAEKMGMLVGEDGIRSGISGWYAPAMNIHRTPFSGRNYEYFSEDGMLSGLIGAAEVKGCRSKGLCTYIKHFAANDVETRRSSLSVWLQEQAFREIYLKSFELAVKKGETNALMASMNRLGPRQTKGSYALLTTVLRNEWGFKGAVITDFTAEKDEYSDMSLAAGVDLQLDTAANSLTQTKTNEVRNALQKAAKNTLYMVANSFVMTSFEEGVEEAKPGIPVWVIAVGAFDGVVLLACGAVELFAIMEYKKRRRADEVLEAL